MKFEIFKYDSVTSTNDIAINLIKEKKKESGYVYADKQTKGRGTQGKKWISNEGNLFGTIFFELKNTYPPFNEFSIINPIIISDIIETFCKEKVISVKWPNDILVNKKKICGILQEVIISNDKKFLLIGIGVNIVSNPILKEKYKATNILFETQNRPEIKELTNMIISSYKKFFLNINSYNFINFKKKAEGMAVD